MPSASIPSGTSITKPEFTNLLTQYPILVSEISKSKGSLVSFISFVAKPKPARRITAKPGQKTLEQLDKYRYGNALEQFSSEKQMTHDDVKLLVEWKLRHGKFRPMLMNLVSSNDSNTVKSIISDAIETYRTSTSPPSAATIATALATLTKLKGIGPATASLLLTVHDPDRVIFFSDEAFYWLCGGGKVCPIKYNNKEYEQLRADATALMKRLDVPATDVEKVAYVLMKQGNSAEASESATPAKSGRQTPAKSQSVKRKNTGSRVVDKAEVGGVRRSKRVKS